MVKVSPYAVLVGVTLGAVSVLLRAEAATRRVCSCRAPLLKRLDELHRLYGELTHNRDLILHNLR